MSHGETAAQRSGKSIGPIAQATCESGPVAVVVDSVKGLGNADE